MRKTPVFKRQGHRVRQQVTGKGIAAAGISQPFGIDIHSGYLRSGTICQPAGKPARSATDIQYGIAFFRTERIRKQAVFPLLYPPAPGSVIPAIVDSRRHVFKT